MSRATLYSPAIRFDGSKVCMSFASGHPGADDPAYVAHREEIAALVLQHGSKNELPPPYIRYTEQEQDAWRLIRHELAVRHESLASSEILTGMDALDLPFDHIPQLADVSNITYARTGFSFQPAAGLIPARDFYLSLKTNNFLATQYIRHHSQPFFSPEPDMVHEIIGHGSALANPRCADLYRSFGEAINRLNSESAINLASTIFWFCIEYGVVRERGEARAFGASLLSSFGELAAFHSATIIALEVNVMGKLGYDVTRYQPTLFCADSFNHMEDFFLGFCEAVDDETHLRMGITGSQT
jgi:phenylalanine-4-hydroxylase